MSAHDLTRERWLRLIESARVAAALPNADPAELRTRADRMREAPSPAEGATRCLCNAFRWACLWFSTSDQLDRVAGAQTLERLCDELAQLIRPRPTPPEAAAAAVAPTLPFAEDAEPAWLDRKDAGRG